MISIVVMNTCFQEKFGRNAWMLVNVSILSKTLVYEREEKREEKSLLFPLICIQEWNVDEAVPNV